MRQLHAAATAAASRNLPKNIQQSENARSSHGEQASEEHTYSFDVLPKALHVVRRTVPI